MWFLAILGMTALVWGCSQYVGKPAPVFDFVTDDPLLERLLKEAAEQWRQAGLAAAALITVNQSSKGFRIKRAPRGQLHTLCHVESDYKGDGCVSKDREGQWEAMFIPDDLFDEKRLRVVILHELGHLLSGRRDHVEGEVRAVMHYNGTSSVPTDVDVAYMEEAGAAIIDPEDTVIAEEAAQ